MFPPSEEHSKGDTNDTKYHKVRNLNIKNAGASENTTYPQIPTDIKSKSSKDLNQIEEEFFNANKTKLFLLFVFLGGIIF